MRQDAWSRSDDDLLAKTVINYISSNKTQLTAFQEVGRELNRTAAACGFRWNSALRHNYRNEIKAAKEERMNNKTNTKIRNTNTNTAMKEDINYMTEIDKAIDALNNLRLEFLNMQETIRMQTNKINELKIEISDGRKERPIASEDLDTLIKIIHRAEQLGFPKNIAHKEEPAI
ncbi:RsfA family transcriptional regulator [Paenibacillus sp. EKM102P]|uniref:RsfA family transcriptional regulator n=1 Tax=unclassified Paenibacillus TaxID=185978 RepID=UPI00142E1BAE|nr:MULTISPECIES: RsfA family transcriptional regulator [unclassified Paenibacillus]KAF6620497.1 RsfA family transcriptional regulator [Paenibacillus sp. EKM101P]KAF6623489.1 RsfA family transcriptional regulator [Paenibacillus sp. EKM102P]KAF6633948.1 RsfA family transcriptional regulator [Paenibacillus sp. EKM10P]KAF6649475.1 RsfA family transcriptional regulator [Paenibacillus sp. EKM11P]